MRGLNRACMRIRIVVSNDRLVASPRISTELVPDGVLDDEGSFSRTQRKFSFSPPQICRENVPGMSGEGMTRKDSKCDIADAVAERMP